MATSTTSNVRRALRALRLTTGDFTALAALIFNDLRNYLASGVFVIATLAIDAVPEKFKTTTIAVYSIAGVVYAKAVTTAIVFTANHVVTAAKFGAILVQIDAAGTISTLVSGATQTTAQAYNTAAAAIAALPAAAAGNVALGYIVIEAEAAGGGHGTWTANTDDMTAASDLVTATFVDATPKTLPVEFV